METVRDIIKRRDGVDDLYFGDLLDEFQAGIYAGDDPEVVMMEVFGLEPDFLFTDDEVTQALRRGLINRALY